MIGKLNEFIAVKITLAVSTMWAFYILVIYGLTPLMWPAHMNTILYWSNFIQLIFLPLLAVGGAVMGRSSEKRAQETHDTVMAEFQGLRRLYQSQSEELAELKAIHAELHVKHDTMAERLAVFMRDGETFDD